MSAADETVQTPPDEGGDSRGKLFRSGKEKKKRRRSRSKQKETGDLQFFDPDYQPFVADDNEDNSCSSTPKYERNFDELAYPVGGTKCALCYCGERSLLGQGDLTRYSPTPGFNPFKKPPLRARGSRELLYGSSPGSNGSQDGYNVGEKVTKTAAVQRRGSKQIRESVKPLYKQEDYSDELSTVGCSEVLEVSQVFEATGHVTAHHCCAAWSEGVTQNESYHLLCVDKAVHMGMSQRCHSCSRYGATVKCRAPKCERLFHYPCAAGSGCFQDIKSMSLLCIDHLELAPTIADPDELSCAVCDDPGQICDLLFCTSCGHHYHGDCLDPHVDVNPVVRAGWQCPECKICQTCRQPGDDNKMLVCDVCDKGYHTFCLRPAMTFIPKNGWCCKNCRRCTDCGSRTPGNGPSSRWHINYQVCDSCYQLRNKGSSCPVCGKAYRNLSSQRVDMNQCKDCKKWVHWTCEDSDTVESGEKPGEEYTCPRCRNPSPSMDDTQPMEELPQDQVIESPMLPEGNPTFISTPPPSESGGPENIEEQEGYVGMPEEVKQCNELSFQSPVPIARKRASTSSSMGSDKASFALKGSSLDPMLGLGEENASDSFESQSIAKSNLESPPRKIRHLSSDGTISMKLKQERHSSAESNLSSIFADDSQQSTISLFGVEPLQTTISPKFIPAQPTEMASSDSKFYSPDQFTLSNQPKVERSASNSPIHYGSPPVRPPGPGMGKPGGMFGKGKPFGHKRKPGGPRTSRGKGKGKGQKRGGFSGPRKRQKGAMLTGVNNSAGGNNTMNAGRSMPRRSRSRFHRQCNSTTQMPESDPSSPAKVEPLLQQIPPADDEYGDSMHNTVVLCSTEDCFTLSQDMCVVCGSFGKGSEGRLIACSQCGQCYHPYCVNLKLTKVVLRKGWRCLDCTVCEECGQVDDPAHLLLCDDCDISYHTQCLRPPLQQVPKGGWKCKWCVRCLHCGTTSPGTNSEWASNYTACGPCASLTHCPRCRRSYKDDDIIMQCGTCERWIHAICEQLYTDSDIEKVLEKGYECCFCRPKDSVPPHLSLVPALPPGEDMYGAGQGMYLGRTRSEVEIVKEYPKDYTTLTITGLQHIQRQMQKYMGLHKKRPAGPKSRRGQKMDMKQKLQVQGGAVTQSPTLVGSGKKEEMAQDSQNTGEELVKEELTDQQAILNQGLDCMADASSATATATEESGLEGNLNDQEVSGMLASSIISPDNLETMSSNADYMESGHPDTTKSTPDVQQTSLKKRRKPYRPGIGGFMVRQRGRGGGLLKPRSRRMHRSRVATTEQSSTNDTKSDTLPSETASEGVGPPVPKTDASINPELPTAKLKVEDVAGTPTSATSADTKPQDQTSTNIPSLKLKIPSQHSSKTPGKRKKRVRLIDQFPPYLQDAFFGKKIITDAKENTNPAQNLDEKPASPGLSYGPKQPNTSCLVLPDRLTQRLEAQAIAQSAALSSSSHTHSTDARSGRHLNQSQDEESAMTEHETEQELLRLLPDIPLRDEELLAFFRQDLKQEQDNTDSHENILSPSALEKMVSGLDHMDGNDMADLFSDVLSHHQEGTNKQDNVPMVQDSTSHEPSQSTHQHVQHKTEGKTQQDTVNEGQAYQQPAVTTLPSQEAKSTVPQQQHEKHQHGLIIQQELQQLQQQYQQKQMMIRQEQLMQNTPQANYCLPQSSHTPPSQNLGHVDVHQGMVSNMPQIQSGPTIGMPAHHIDPNRSHSHHGTPVMSPMPNTQHPLSQIHQPSHSPLATPTPGMGQVTHFMRQGSIPSGMHSGMHTPTAAAAGPNEGVSVQQLQQHLQVHMQQQNIGVTSTSPTVTQSKGAVSGHLPHNEIRQSAVTGTYQQQQGVPTSTYSQHTSDPYPGTAPAPTSSFSQQAPQVPSQLPTHMHNVPGAYTQQRSIGAESYMSNNEAGLVQHHISMTPSQQVPKSISMHQVVASYAQQASNAVATSLTAPSTMQTVMHQTLMTTTHTTISASPAKAVIATEPTQKIEDVLVPTQLPDFTGLGRDTSLFEPSPRPWPLGTELEGDSLSVNQRNILKWEKDEPLGELATISPVLYANVKHKNLKKEFPDWPTRAKQVAKLWRKASSDERAPFLIKARDNRALLKANRARRGDDISVTKTPTPPLPTEELDVKPVELDKTSVPAVSTAPDDLRHTVKQEYQPQGNQQAQVSTMETEAKDMSSTILAGISSDQQQSIMSSGSYVASTISAHNIPESKPAIATMTAKAVDTTAESLSRRESTTPGQISSTCGIDFVLDAESGIVKQQPRSLSTSDMQSDDHSTMDTGYTPTTAQTSIGQIAPPKQVIAKVERHRSSDYSVPSPYPVSKTPSQQDYTVKQVSRSLSLGADANLPQHASARSGVQEQIVLGTTRSVTPQYSQVTSKTKAAKPSKAEKNAVSKERALSVDSGLIAPATTVPSDDAKPASTSSLQMRPVQYPVTSQRNSRRARLWEQQPPPYSTQSSPSPATSGTTSFMYPAQIIHRHQVVPISGQRMQILSPGPHGMHSLQPAGPGVIAFQLEGSQAQGFPPGHLISQPRPPFPGHPMKGYQNPPGRYIELRHSNQSDPATRRQKILRMGNVYSSNQNQSQATPVVQSKDVSPTSEASSSDKAQEKQSDLPTSTTTATSVVDTKSVDPFVGGHIPHDEHLDALLRSDEFKHLHFQAAQGKLQDAAALQVATPASLASSLAAAVAAVNSPSLVTLTSQKSKKDKPSEGRKEDAVASATTGDGTKTTQTVPTVSNTSSNDSVSATNTTASNTLELKENEDEMVKKIEQNISEGKVPEDNQEGEKEEIVTESFIGILKSDHSYFKSSKSEEEPTVSVAVAKLPEAPSMEKDNVEDGDSGTKLRGVGLTPPPESELSQFVPTDENDMQQESSSALTVSNVITVPVVPDHRTLSPSPPNIFSKGTAVERDKMEIGKNILGAEGSEEKIKEYQVVIEDERTSMKTKEDDDKKDAVASSVQSTGEESKAVSEVSDQEMAGENVETKKTQLISSDDILSVQSEAAPSHYEKDKPGTDIILTSDDHLVPVDPVSSMVESTEKSSSEDGRGVLDKVSLESTQVPNDCDQNMVESREKATSETAHTETAEMKFTDDVDIRGIVEISSVEQKQVASSCITHTEGTTHDVTVEESKLEKTATENRSKDSDQCVSVPKQEDSQIPTSVTIKERVQQPPNPEKNSVLLCTSTGNVDATSTSESAVIEPSVTAPVEVKTREEIDKNAEVVSEDNLPKNTTTEYTASATAVPINRNSPTLVPKTSTSSQENISELAKTVIPTQFIISSHALDVTNSSSCVPTVSFQAIDSAECSHATTAPVHSTASAPASVVALPATVSATTMADTQTAAEILSASSVMQTVSQISTASNPGQVGQTPLLSTYTLATSTAVTPAVVPAVVSSATVPVSTVSQLTATTISVTTTTQPASVSSQSGTSTNTSPQNLLKKKHLLIKEQPLLLQELLEEEKREQERARLEKLRHSQSLLQQQAVVQPSTPAMFPVSAMELEKAAPDGGIDNIKMKFLSRINQAAQAGLPGVPPTAPIENVITPMHVPKTSGTPWQTHIASPALQQAGSQAQYTDWLIQHQQILQIQVQKHEQLFQMKKQRKQSLMKKRTQCKKSEGKKEFTQEEADELKAITKQCSETQQQLEKLRNSQKQHAELFQEFNIKQQCMVGIMHTAGSVGGTAGTVVGQQQPQMATVVDAQGQQQIMIQQRMPGQHVVVSQVQGPAGLQGQSVIPSQNMGMPHQLLMMQQSQQQLLIKSVPTSTSSVTSSPTPGTMTVQQQQQAPQQQQVVMASQQQQQQGIFSHMQKITGMRPNPAELQQLMMNQHQLHQQQQLQQQLQKQVIVGQPGLKAAQTRPHFISPQTSLASNQSLTTGGPSISGNQTHNAFMQMQMDQLLALQIEQQQQLAAMQQQMGADKPKTKRKRKKRKSQAEKEAEEQQQQQQQQLLAQQQHMQQNAMVGNLPITSQQQPTSGAFGGLWHHRPGIPQQQQHVMPNIRPQMTVQSRPMFSMPSQTLHIQPSGSGALPTSIVQVRHPGVTSLPPTNVIGAPSPMGQHGYTQQMAISKSSPLISTHHGVHHTHVSSATTVMSSVASSGPIVMASVTHPAASCSGISTTVAGVTATTSALQALQRSIAGPVRVANNSAMAMTSSTTATTFVTASGIPTATPLSQQPSTVSIVNASSAHQMQFPQASQQQFSDSKIIKKDVCSSVSSGPTNKAETEKTAVTSAALPSPSMNSVHELATNSNTSTLSQIISESSTSTQVISSIIATSAGVPGSPRIHSPVLSNMENLSEAELAILMAHDPDLNKEEEAIRTMTGTTSTVLTPPSSSTPAPDQEEKSPKDEQKKKRRPKKGFVMDKRTIETINSSINNVIRLSLEYEDKLQAAKGAGTAVTTPSPWTLDPKPTKFPEKKSNQSSPSGLDDTSAKGGNKELLKHLLKTGQAGSAIANMPEAMYSQMATGYGIQSSVAGGMLHMECYSSMPPEQLKMLKGMAPYLMKQTSAELVEAGQKKKRARRGSKEGGPDGAKGPKRRRKKDKNVIPQPAYTMSTTGQVPAMPSGMIMQAVGQQGTMIAGTPGTVGAMVPYVAPGAIGPVPATDISKPITAWKALPLLNLLEPKIRLSHHMCVPKGMGLSECRSLLVGEMGNSSFHDIPDFFNLLLDLEKESPPQPPTPPTSSPPSPTSKQCLQQVTGIAVHHRVANTDTTPSNAVTTMTDKTLHQVPGDQVSARYGPLGLSGEADQYRQQSPLVKIPDSLPTPPHQGIEDKEESSMLSKSLEDSIIPPSSPEIDDEDEWFPQTFTSLNREGATTRQLLHVATEEGNIRLSPSPDIPLLKFPKIYVPTDHSIKSGILNDKDSVSVTIEFDNTNIKSIEKSLTLLSKILDTSIISYSMVDVSRAEKKLKDMVVKEKQMNVPIQAHQNQAQKTTPEVEGMPPQHRCVYCGAVVAGNGVRKPQFDVSKYEEDVIFCNKECYLKAELWEKKTPRGSVKKKFKASHIYQRHTCKLNMTALLERFPEEDPLTPSKIQRGLLDTPTGVPEVNRGAGLDGRGRGRGRRRGIGGAEEPKVASKKWRGIKWKKWTVGFAVVKTNTKPPVDVDALLIKYGSALKPPPEVIDKRYCAFCNKCGDGDTHTVARLLNVDVDRWVHLNCALWSAEVYETQGGALINVDLALRRSESVLCCSCQRKGATIHCHRPRCINTYHCQCALDIKCVFFKDKTVLCPTHAPKPGGGPAATGVSPHQHHHSSDTLRSLAVFRKVYVQRPETKQIASIMQQGELSQGEKNYVLRVGALIFENVGQLATHQMAVCHSSTAIYPVGYKSTRIFWSSTNMRRRCRYECYVDEVEGKPNFLMKYKAALPGKNKPEKTQMHAREYTQIVSDNVNELWLQMLKPLEKLRSQHNVLKLFPAYINGEKLFGLTTPVVARILESLPNIELCAEYKFRYGRTPLLELPLAINPTGCARSEPHIKQHRKKPHTLISNLISEYYESSGIGDVASLYGKQFVHSKSSQYRKMKQEWRQNVYLARSRIQGLGLFSAKDIEPGTMVIEYIGDIIRIEVSEKREKMYESTNRGVYMFRLDSDHIVDATVTGGPARYINHSCNPNCVAEVVNFEKEKKIMIVSNRHILKGEELSYDYKFDFEDEGRKIPCLCGASNCKKWMN